MSKSSIPQNQLELFDWAGNQSSEPHPIVLSRKHNFQLRFADMQPERLYCIQDWIAGIATCNAVQSTDIWRKSKLRNSIPQLQELPIEAANGAVYQMEHTDQYGLYAIAQHMRITKNRPILQEVKDYLLTAGCFVDAIRTNKNGARDQLQNALTFANPDQALESWVESQEKQGKSPLWASRRAMQSVSGKEQRRIASENLDHEPDEFFYVNLINSGYRGAFGMDAQELGTSLDMPKDKKGKNKGTPLDYMTTHDLTLITMYQNLSAAKMEAKGRPLTSHEEFQIVFAIARHARVAIEEVIKVAGLNPDNLLSGYPMLENE